MSKIVLGLGHKPGKRYNFTRDAEPLEMYQTAQVGQFVELTNEIEGWIERITLSENRDVKYIFISANNKEEFEKILQADSRWVLRDNPIVEAGED